MSRKNLGATGRFLDGKVSKDDEGEMQMMVGTDRNGYVRLDFGTPVVWLALPPQQAVEFATMILKHAGVLQ